MSDPYGNPEKLSTGLCKLASRRDPGETVDDIRQIQRRRMVKKPLAGRGHEELLLKIEKLERENEALTRA